MGTRRIAALAVCGTAGLAGLYPQAAVADSSTVYVNSDKTVCSDTSATAGAQDTPFCTLPAALASPSVVAGTTLLLSGSWTGGVRITKSDLTIQAAPQGASFVKGMFGLSISGQHDVALRGLTFQSPAGRAIEAVSSSGITVSGVSTYDSRPGIAGAIEFNGVSASSVTDSRMLGGSGYGIMIWNGSSNVVASNDVVSGQWSGGVEVIDSSTVDIVADTVDGNCGNGITVFRTASDVRIENDIAAADPQQGMRCDSAAPTFGVSVADSATSGTTVGYTLATTWAVNGQAFQWGEQGYTDAAAFDTAAHGTADLIGEPDFASEANWSNGLRDSYQLASASPAIDSADSSARHEPAVDLVGSARKPDPVGVDAQLGTGTPAYADRGALEYQPTVPGNGLGFQVDPHVGTYLHVKAMLNIDPRWPVTSCAFDFGSGYQPASSSCTAEHTFAGPGVYPVSVAVTDAYGNSWTDSDSINVHPDYVNPAFSVNQFNGLVNVTIYPPQNPGSATVDFGDGSPAVAVDLSGGGSRNVPPHQYPSSGTYTITVHETDSLGFTGSSSQSADVVTYNVHPAIHRIAGGDRFATAVAASQAQWAAGTADAVVLASGADYPDALTGVPLAAHVHGPLLLSDPDTLDAATAAEITRVLGPGAAKTVYLLGGRNALSDKVAAALPASVKVVRLGGRDRFETARLVSQTIGTAKGFVVASGLGFADALSAGPLAAKQGAAILLSDGATLDPQTTAELAAARSPITAVGGPAATAVRADVPLAGRTFTDLHGSDRYATASAVVDATTAGTIPHSISFASGANFPDALAGGAFAATAGQPLLLTDPQTLSQYADDHLERWHLFEWNGVVSVFGGPAAVSDKVIAAIQKDTNGRIS